MATFAEQISKLTDKYQKRIDDTVRGTIVGIAGDMVGNAAVGQWDMWSDMGKNLNPKPPYTPGEFKGSFNYSFGGVPDSYTPTIDPSGSASMGRIRAAVMTSPVAGRHYIYNNAPYAMTIENNRHPTIQNWSLTPPNEQRTNLMYRAIINAPQIIRKITARYI